MERRLAKVEGRVDEANHAAARALDEAKLARQTASGAPAGPLPRRRAGREHGPRRGDADGLLAGAAADGGPLRPAGEQVESGASVSEVSAYRDAHASYRSGDYDACIDRFRGFLQTYPASPYADDAAYWMAECHFKKGDYKSAVLRFDDVVARYPEGDKSADALYRQGEALLKLGPGYAKAAGKAFERVIAEYPNSARAERSEEATRNAEHAG